MKNTLQITKSEAIAALGGTPGAAAQALGYKSVQAVYVWPDVLTPEVSDRVRGAWMRLNTGASKAPALRRRRRSWLVRSGRLM